MNAPDLINGCFEAVGAYFTWANFRSYLRVRELRGVYWPTTAFFTAWGFWNLAYYPTIGQPISFVGGVALMLGNVAWLSLVLFDKYVALAHRKIENAYDFGYRRALSHITPNDDGLRVWGAADRDIDLAKLRGPK